MVAEVAIAVLGAIALAAVGWVLYNIGKKRPFKVTSAAFVHLPATEPVHTMLVLSVERANKEVSPKVTSVTFRDERGVPQDDYTVKGSDTQRFRDGKALSETANDSVYVEILDKGRSGLFDLAGWQVELHVSRTAKVIATLVPADVGA
jgi:hypothetical protein